MSQGIVSQEPVGSAGPLNAFFSIWTWVAVAGAVVLCFFTQLLLAPLTWPLDRQRRVTGRLLRLMVGVMGSQLTPLWHFRVYGALPERLPSRFVAVSNHESQADPFIISRLPWEMKWLCKASLFKIPFAGWGMWLAGDIPLYRGDRSSAQDAMALCRRRIEAGMPVMIFPEGTRSNTGEMLPFKAGAFRLAIETGADILPIAIFGTRQALPKHSWRVGKSRALVTVGKPIPTQGMGADDVPKLTEMARSQIESLRRQLALEIAKS